jgi:Uma2 family endonuclease
MSVLEQKLTSERFRELYRESKPYFELIDGVPEQKPAGTWDNSRLQTVLAVMLGELGFRPLIELTLAISEIWELTPDVVGFLGPKPEGPYPTKPVAAAVEILSDDPFLRLNDKCEKYSEWGIPDILVFDPLARRTWHWDRTLASLIPVPEKYRFHSLAAAELHLEDVFRRLDES